MECRVPIVSEALLAAEAPCLAETRFIGVAHFLCAGMDAAHDIRKLRLRGKLRARVRTAALSCLALWQGMPALGPFGVTWGALFARDIFAWAEDVFACVCCVCHKHGIVVRWFRVVSFTFCQNALSDMLCCRFSAESL